MTDLPTIEQCRTFLATINRGRVAIGLEPLDVLDFDGAEPDQGSCCLSATNLFAAAGCTVGATLVYPTGDHWGKPPAALCVVLDGGEKLPAEIRAVTDVFDACSHDDEVVQAMALAALRARMVAAGVVR